MAIQWVKRKCVRYPAVKMGGRRGGFTAIGRRKWPSHDERRDSL